MDPPLLPELPNLIRDLKEASNLPLSLSVSPLSAEFLKKLKEAGADRVGIALDAASPDIFERVKGAGVGNPHTFASIKEALLRAVSIFGKGYVSTHIIIGLGETDSQVLEVLKWSRDNGIIVSLFALTKVRGGPDLGPPPPIGRYRSLQAVRHLVMELGIVDGISIDGSGKIVSIPDIATFDREGWKSAFETRGCPDCNRPYYNERPGGTIYNHPVPLREEQATIALMEVAKYVNGS
jgi:biotin synthase